MHVVVQLLLVGEPLGYDVEPAGSHKHSSVGVDTVRIGVVAVEFPPVVPGDRKAAH